MGNDDPDPADESTEAALALPSLGFGRRRKRQDKDADEAPPPDPVDPAEEPAAEPVSEPVEKPVEEPVEEPVAGVVTEPIEAPAEEPSPEPVREPLGKRVADAFRRPADDEPTRVQEPAAAGRGWSTLTGSSGDAEATTQASSGGGGGTRSTGAGGRKPSIPKPALPSISVAGLSGRLAAVVVGALAGLLLVGGVKLTMTGCDLVRGTSACGGGPGFLLIVLLVAAVIVAAAAGLRITGVPYPGTISFLGVGLVLVIVLFFLLGVIYSPLMLVVIPLLTAASFVLAHGLSASFGDWSGPDWR